MQRFTAVFVDMDATFNQIVVQQAGTHFHNRHIRFTLHNEFYPNAASCCFTQSMQQAITGKEIGIGNDHFPSGLGQHFKIMAFNIIAMLFVIAPDKQRLRFAGAMIVDCPVMTSPPASYGALPGQVFQYKVQNVSNDWTFNAHGVILLGLRAVIRHMFSGVIDAADKGNTVINDHYFSMHTAKEIGAHSKKTRTRIVVAENNTGYGQLFNKTVAQIRRAVAIQQHLCFDSSSGGFEQRGMQLFSYRIFKPDKSLKDNFLLCLLNGVKDGGVELIAVFQQLNLIAFTPAIFHK